MTANVNLAPKVLLIDDDPTMVRLLTKIIERSFSGRLELVSQTDPHQARAWIEDNVVDVLLTDLEMPAVNGLQLLRCAKHRNPSAQVFFITGHSTLHALTEALEFGATDYLLKPIDQAELIELLETALKRVHRWRQALAGTLTNMRYS